MAKTYGNISVKGILRKIIFHKPETGFMIGSFENNEFDDDDDAIFIALGSILKPQTGIEYSLTGEWKENDKYGRQFAFEFFQTIEPKDLNGIHKYLVRICKFVGTATASYIIDEFGEDTLRMLREEPETVSSLIRGVTLERALDIQQALLENAATEAAMIELETMLDISGMIKATPMRLIDKFGSNAPDVLRRDPYILTQFPGIGFVMADRVAIKIGFDPQGIARKKAVAWHILDEIGQTNGDVWISREDLQIQMLALVPVNNIFDGVDALVDSGEWEKWDTAYTSSIKSFDEAYIAERITEGVN